jgi:outer membrane murein-binding lipoprotein Lpp
MYLKKLGALGLTVALSLAVVGCGGSTKDDQADTADPAAQSDQQADQQADASSTTADGDSSDADSKLTDSLDALNKGELGDCLTASMAYASLVLAPAGFAGGATEEEIDEFEKNTQELQAKIPSELKDDFETVATAYQAYGEALEGIDAGDLLDPDTQSKLQEAGEKLDDPQVEAASKRISDYFDHNCDS